MIQERYGPEVELCDIGSGGLALLDHLHSQELMIVVDACFQGKPPGEICVMEPNLDTQTMDVTSVHQIGPLETLAVAKRLFQEKMPQRILLIIVETNGIDDKTEKAACQQVVAILDMEIEAWQRNHITSIGK
ncbi:methyl viologen-reducing hydrogenase maturation protease [Candidatus Thiomargarita nelsonii]|uniref:Methyl viologen-reducing hydrogenase maturation protease n=1 Tax=Candidatus Thiomargarita nelsonii TaxID=1003181 RepID=A0A0A6P219_9GAMM|nr:methyl viologen-reducing hydrogenase maturation protease [Candidatus Thiomargarita nelsonii]